MHAHLFVTLLNRPEWQKDWGWNAAHRHPEVLPPGEQNQAEHSEHSSTSSNAQMCPNRSLI